MPLRTVVKVGSVTNLSDARYCAGMGVDMLGFNVQKGQENYVPPKQFQEIRGWVTGPLVVAEVYGIKRQDELNDILENYKPDYLEMGLAEFSLFASFPLPIILFIAENESVPDSHVMPAYLLSEVARNTPDTYPLLLAIKSEHDLDLALDNPHIEGIAMKGSNELRPGLKDYAVLAEILERLEVD
ncbi:MAG: hypothetical protein OEV24_06385 [Cyclobacteriaceae bacterium]|nr:hypothetical protein [Cyclobacteriaceae bacterium]